jgi:DNA-binding response OmpR family regulator
MILGEGGFSTDIAYDAMGAKQPLANNQYIVMILDLLLPGQDRTSLIRELREQGSIRNLPIVLVSAKAQHARQKLTNINYNDNHRLTRQSNRSNPSHRCSKAGYSAASQ